jgi:hypothetical protein
MVGMYSTLIIIPAISCKVRIPTPSLSLSLSISTAFKFSVTKFYNFFFLKKKFIKYLNSFEWDLLQCFANCFRHLVYLFLYFNFEANKQEE